MKLNFLQFDQFKMIDIYDSCKYSQSNIIEMLDLFAYYCRLLITFTNSLDPDQAWQNVIPDRDSNCLTRWWSSWNSFRMSW